MSPLTKTWNIVANAKQFKSWCLVQQNPVTLRQQTFVWYRQSALAPRNSLKFSVWRCSYCFSCLGRLQRSALAFSVGYLLVFLEIRPWQFGFVISCHKRGSRSSILVAKYYYVRKVSWHVPVGWKLWSVYNNFLGLISLHNFFDIIKAQQLLGNHYD